MVEPAPSRISCKDQLERLLQDPEFLKIVELTSREVMHAWNVSNQVARGFVVSTVGEPEALAHVYDVWFAAKDGGQRLGRAKLMIRRRVIELLREDARHPVRGPERQPADALVRGRGLGAGGGALT